jgi:hypothetical protein
MQAWKEEGFTEDDAWDVLRDSLDADGAEVEGGKVVVETETELPNSRKEVVLRMEAPYTKPTKSDSDYSPTDQMYDQVESGSASISVRFK